MTFEDLPDMIAQGMKPKEAAIVLGVPAQVIYRQAARQGVCLKRRRKLILAALADGADTAPAIAGRVRASRRTAELWLERLHAEGEVEMVSAFVPGRAIHWRIARDGE